MTVRSTGKTFAVTGGERMPAFSSANMSQVLKCGSVLTSAAHSVPLSNPPLPILSLKSFSHLPSHLKSPDAYFSSILALSATQAMRAGSAVGFPVSVPHAASINPDNSGSSDFGALESDVDVIVAWNAGRSAHSCTPGIEASQSPG